ncbi:MAG: L,D-transpeptidase [Acidobacteriota bacterium]|nr:L,D-transpeptidase [Acidobacteriota bacterium]
MRILLRKNTFIAGLTAFLFFVFAIGDASAQSYVQDMKRESARSDKLTGGAIEKTALAGGGGNLKITVNVPAFQMTLWQDGKEVKTYSIGVGLKEYPIYVGFLRASAVIWNPSWIPPDSDWVSGSKKVKVGEIILPTDPRNPLGKMKIPLGSGYLIHQAKGVGDLGSLVSHGCVRVLQADLYDLADKIVAARELDLTPKQIMVAERTKKTLSAELKPVIPVEVTYDTMVVEAGRLHIYPDVYDRKKNTIENLRAELRSSGVDAPNLSDATLEKMLARAVSKKQFVVSVKNIEAGRALLRGQTIAVVTSLPRTKSKTTGSTVRKRRASR